MISTYARKRCYSSTTGRQRHRENQPTESDAKYWKRTVTIPFLDVICSELKRRRPQHGKEGRHYELCALIPQVIVSKSEEATVELAQVLIRSGAI